MLSIYEKLNLIKAQDQSNNEEIYVPDTALIKKYQLFELYIALVNLNTDIDTKIKLLQDIAKGKLLMDYLNDPVLQNSPLVDIAAQINDFYCRVSNQPNHEILAAKAFFQKEVARYLEFIIGDHPEVNKTFIKGEDDHLVNAASKLIKTKEHYQQKKRLSLGWTLGSLFMVGAALYYQYRHENPNPRFKPFCYASFLLAIAGLYEGSEKYFEGINNQKIFDYTKTLYQAKFVNQPAKMKFFTVEDKPITPDPAESFVDINQYNNRRY